ncbi:MAG: SpoIID/LytB domain-containing protein [Candidatus Eremiobacteraeota bacterium]|nr:SpoIID/LytB domain-containing protein [Candidatus Eremiobacteraeota bacterium]
MKRRTFCVVSGAAVGCLAVGRIASALDVPTIRVLLGRGSALPIDADSFSFGTRTFRGRFSILPDGQVINIVALEQYLYGVVPMESPRTWPEPTLQAQAILARTFALARVNESHPYDLVASQRDQAYGGIGAEHRETSEAVDATARQIVTYGGVPASVSYMSCCGGHTEAASDAWAGGVDHPYLQGVVCNYCSASPDYRWTSTVPWNTVVNVLTPQFDGFGVLRSVGIGATTRSGRVKMLSFSDGTQQRDVTGADFRRAAGSMLVKSLLLRSVHVRQGGSDLADPTQGEAAIVVDGAGRGHGVGLCQWGARGLGAQRRNPRDIIAYYFPGTQVTALS